MTFAHIVLGLTALFMIAESCWGLCAPAHLRGTARTALDEGSEQGGLARPLFWSLALAYWAVAWFGQQWAHRILFFFGVFFLIIGELMAHARFREQCYQRLLGNRSNFQVRLIYAGEGVLAIGLLWLAICGL